MPGGVTHSLAPAASSARINGLFTPLNEAALNAAPTPWHPGRGGCGQQREARAHSLPAIDLDLRPARKRIASCPEAGMKK